jgi:hypothetical protein
VSNGVSNDNSTSEHLALVFSVSLAVEAIAHCALVQGKERVRPRLAEVRKKRDHHKPYQHHTNIPITGINVYSFALKPEEHQPSGTCNMSRIDNATLQLQLTPKAALGSKIRVYATNYNVLRIMSGMGGLAYSN